MALVTTAFLQVRPGFAGVSDSTLEPIIDDASALVVDYVKPLLDDADETTCPAAVQAVVANMCRRGMSNPRGASQETLGDYSYTMGSDGGVATLYMTAREKKIVRYAVGKLGAGSVAMEGYLPLAYSERTATSGTDPWDAVEQGLD